MFASPTSQISVNICKSRCIGNSLFYPQITIYSQDGLGQPPGLGYPQENNLTLKIVNDQNLVYRQGEITLHTQSIICHQYNWNFRSLIQEPLLVQIQLLQKKKEQFYRIKYHNKCSWFTVVCQLISHAFSSHSYASLAHGHKSVLQYQKPFSLCCH